MNNNAKLSKIIISSKDGKKQAGEKESKYEVMINPSSVNHTHGINYATNQSDGMVNTDAKFQNVSPETLSFEIIIDGTGATGIKKIVNDEIKTLKGVIYNYQGEMHEPPHAKIAWGDTLQFEGRLTNMDVTHTLFAPNGQSLRAKISLKFISSMDLEEQKKKKENASPDLTHLVTVKVGDTLPLMCQRIYNKSQYYLQVAKINNLVDFRNLVPGQELIFPPIKK